MARKPTGWWWWRKRRKQWMTTIDGNRIYLGPNKQAAEKQSHELMAGRRAVSASDGVILILDNFVTLCYENRAESTAERYLGTSAPLQR